MFTTTATMQTEIKPPKIVHSKSRNCALVGYFAYGDYIFILSSDSCADALQQIWSGKPDLNNPDKSWQKQVIDCACRNTQIVFYSARAHTHAYKHMKYKRSRGTLARVSRTCECTGGAITS